MHTFFLKKNIKDNIFNIGFENLSILKIAQMVSSEIPSDIKIIKKFVDVRSYNLDSSKLLKHGFKPNKGIIDAIRELKKFYKKKFKDKPNFHSISWLREKLKKH